MNPSHNRDLRYKLIKFAENYNTPIVIYPTISFPEKPRFRVVFFVKRQLNEKNYFKASEQRLKNTKPIEDDFLDTLKNNRSKPRIPFGSLVELGIIKPGTSIFDPKKKIPIK